MRTPTRSRRLLTLGLSGVLGLGLAALGPSAPAMGQTDISFGDTMTNSGLNLLVGGDYAWRLDVNQPAPAYMYDVPTALSQQVGAEPLAVTFHWGDGATTTILSNEAPGPSQLAWMWCDNYYQVDNGTDPPTYTPGDNFGYSCGVEAGHSYSRQGVYSIYLTATQTTDEGTATGRSAPFEYLIVDTALGGSLTAKGTVMAPANSGGMYDQDFTGGTVTFGVTAKRRDGTLATTASVTVNAPSMTPDYPTDEPLPQGMTFTGKAAQQPLYITRTKGGGEAILSRLEGNVTNSRGPAGRAWMTIHTIVQKGQPTLVRILVQNTSAGFTYLDTGYQPSSYFSLDPNDLLQSGSVKIG